MAKLLKIDGAGVPLNIHLMGSALGMRYRKTTLRKGRNYYKPYRNYFGTYAGCADNAEWERMVRIGHAEIISTDGDGRSYRVTDEGKQYIGEYFDVTMV